MSCASVVFRFDSMTFYPIFRFSFSCYIQDVALSSENEEPERRQFPLGKIAINLELSSTNWDMSWVSGMNIR